MPTLEQLRVQIDAQGAAKADAEIKRVGSSVDNLDKKLKSSQPSFRTMLNDLSSMAFLGGNLTQVIQQVGMLIGALTGIGQAAQFQRIEQGLAVLLRSKDAARQLAAELRRIGQETPFETLEVVRFGQQLLSAGFAAKTVAADVRTLTNAGAALGRDTGQMERAIGAITRMGRDVNSIDVDEINEFTNALGINLGRIVGNVRGKPTSEAEAATFLQGKPGQEAARLIMEGLRKEFGKPDTNFLAVVQNIADTAANIMLPTGRILIAVFTPFLLLVRNVASALAAINEMTGGFAGLGLLVGLMARGWTILTGGILHAITAVNALTASLNRFAAAAGVSTAANAAGGIGGFLGSLSKRGKIGLGLGIGALGLGAFGADRIAGPGGKLLENLTGFVGMGAGIGSFGGLQGAAIGAAVGAVAAIGKTLYDHFTAQNASNPMLSEAKKQTQALQDIRAQLVGGGERANMAKADIEFAWAKMAATGIG